LKHKHYPFLKTHPASHVEQPWPSSHVCWAEICNYFSKISELSKHACNGLAMSWKHPQYARMVLH